LTPDAADFLVTIGPLADLTAAEHADDLTFAEIGWLSEVTGRGSEVTPPPGPHTLEG
jgi:hypothetical protein